jgi:hypothetical protein
MFFCFNLANVFGKKWKNRANSRKNVDHKKFAKNLGLEICTSKYGL